MRKLARTVVMAVSVIATPLTAAPAKADGVYVSPPYGAYLYPRPLRPWLYSAAPVYVAPAPIYVGPRCAWRTVRAWVNGHYVVRRVSTCY